MDPERTRDTLLRITARRAEVLREIADGYTGREAARRIGLTHSGMRSHVEALKEITGCSSARELGRWWRRNHVVWLRLMSVQAGIADMAGDEEPPSRPYEHTTSMRGLESRRPVRAAHFGSGAEPPVPSRRGARSD